MSPRLHLLVFSTICLGVMSCAPHAGISIPAGGMLIQRVTDHRGDSKIPLHFDKNRTIAFVPCTIGKTKGWLGVDTGAPFTVIISEIADANGFDEQSRGTLNSPAGQTVSISSGTLFSLKLDEIEVMMPLVLRQENVSYFRSLPKPPGRGPVLGLLGMQTLDLIDARIDLREGVIHLGPGAGKSR